MDMNIDTIIRNFVNNVNFIPPIVLVLFVALVPLLVWYVLSESGSEALTTDLKVVLGMSSAVSVLLYLPLKFFHVTWKYQDTIPAEGIFPALAAVAILSVAAVAYFVRGLRDPLDDLS